jgi:hypothetical protein
MNLTNALQRVQHYLTNGENMGPKQLPPLVVVVEEARREWLNAQYYYNTVSADQDLIDHAVYLMQAAEKKYVYLLKQARNAGIVSSSYVTPADVGVSKNETMVP